MGYGYEVKQMYEEIYIINEIANRNDDYEPDEDELIFIKSVLEKIGAMIKIINEEIDVQLSWDGGGD